MVKGLSQLFAAGPAVVEALGEESDKESLGGSAIHTRNGVVDDEVESEAEAFARARHFLAFMPEHAGALARRTRCDDPADRREDDLLSLVPRDPKAVYSMRRALELIVDRGTLFEIGARWGRAVITALARLDGWPVAVLASDPSFLGGSWEAKTSEKVRRFVELADRFRLPVVHLVDNPGFMIGRAAEEAGTIRYGVEAMNAVYRATVPIACVVTRRAYGIAGSAMSNADRFQWRFAWPSGDWGSLPIEGGIEVAYKAEIEAADDPAAHLAAIRERLNRVRSPFRSAERFSIEDIIDPRDTRPLLCDFAGGGVAGAGGVAPPEMTTRPRPPDRHPSESWDLPQQRTTWLREIPAFAGMTVVGPTTLPPSPPASARTAARVRSTSPAPG